MCIKKKKKLGALYNYWGTHYSRLDQKFKSTNAYVILYHPSWIIIDKIAIFNFILTNELAPCCFRFLIMAHGVRYLRVSFTMTSLSIFCAIGQFKNKIIVFISDWVLYLLINHTVKPRNDYEVLELRVSLPGVTKKTI